MTLPSSVLLRHRGQGFQSGLAASSVGLLYQFERQLIAERRLGRGNAVILQKRKHQGQLTVFQQERKCYCEEKDLAIARIGVLEDKIREVQSIRWPALLWRMSWKYECANQERRWSCAREVGAPRTALDWAGAPRERARGKPPCCGGDSEADAVCQENLSYFFQLCPQQTDLHLSSTPIDGLDSTCSSSSLVSAVTLLSVQLRPRDY